MKHWGELTDLETQIIRVGEFKNLFKLLVAGTENYVDIKVLQSAIYTMEGMIDDIDSTLYEKFQTVWDAVKDEYTTEGGEEEFEFNFSTMDDAPVTGYGSDTITITEFENQGSTVHINSTYEEDEAFKELEKAIKNWHQASK
jgi:hypothetical protein